MTEPTTPEAIEVVAARQWGKSPADAHPDVVSAMPKRRTLRQDISALIDEYEGRVLGLGDDDAEDYDAEVFHGGCLLVVRRLRSILGRHLPEDPVHDVDGFNYSSGQFDDLETEHA